MAFASAECFNKAVCVSYASNCIQNVRIINTDHPFLDFVCSKAAHKLICDSS